MSKKLEEIAGARCSFCKRPALPDKGGVGFLARGFAKPKDGVAVPYICKDCIRRCAELLPVCPLKGVLRFKPKEEPKK